MINLTGSTDDELHPELPSKFWVIRWRMILYMWKQLANKRKTATKHYLFHNDRTPESKQRILFCFTQNEKDWGSDKAISIRLVQFDADGKVADDVLPEEIEKVVTTTTSNHIRLGAGYCSRKKGREIWNQCVSGLITNYKMEMPVFEPDMLEHIRERVNDPIRPANYIDYDDLLVINNSIMRQHHKQMKEFEKKYETV